MTTSCPGTLCSKGNHPVGAIPQLVLHEKTCKAIIAGRHPARAVSGISSRFRFSAFPGQDASKDPALIYSHLIAKSLSGALLSVAIGLIPGLAGAAENGKAPAACPALLQQSYSRLQDEKPQSLCQYAGKVLVVVNTASFCGFTPQYEALEALNSRYQSRGLVVLGFPSNDFSQETGSNRQIAEFCENTFGVKFPMFTKSSVRGKDAIALFRELAARSGQAPQWNFHKYVVARDGVTVTSFNSSADPAGKEFAQEIEKQLRRSPR
jgi:glutathione peroxidase